MPLFKSLRSKSRKGSFGTTTGASEVGSITGNDAQESTNTHAVTMDSRPQAAPPLSPSATAMSLEKKKSKLFSSGSVSGRRKNSHSQGDVPAGRPSLSTNISTSGHFLGRSYSKPGTATNQHPASSPPQSPSSPPPPLPPLQAGPRPSDLFAGKGRQWGDFDGNLSTQSGTAAGAGTTVGGLGLGAGGNGGDAKADDLQNFLKARRQWVPTFVTEFKDEPDVKQVSKPDDITFSSVPQTGSLMSLKDLDESHQRKQKLLGGSFLASSAKDASDWLPPASAGPSTTSGATTAASGPPPSAAGRAIAINTAATATASTPLTTVTGGPPVAVNNTASSSTSSSGDTTATRGKKSGSINRKPVPAVAATNGDGIQQVNGSTSGAETTPAPASAPVPAPEPAAAAAATSAALNGAPSASTGGFVDASEPTATSGAAADSAAASASAPPQAPPPSQAAQDTTPPTQAHAHPRASMETSGTGAFQTPDASAPQSEVGHFVGMSKSPSATSAGNGNPIAELNQSIRGAGGGAEESTEVVPAQHA